MRFVVSDNDMKGRFEQTMLMLGTLEHFGYSHFDHVVMHGGHCHYFRTFNEDDTTLASHMIEDFLGNADSI